MRYIKDGLVMVWLYDCRSCSSFSRCGGNRDYLCAVRAWYVTLEGLDVFGERVSVEMVGMGRRNEAMGL